MTNIIDITDTDDKDAKDVAQDLVDKLDSMQKDADRKLKFAKEQFVNKLDTLAAKYRTANGVKSAMDTIYSLLPNENNVEACSVIYDAQDMASALSDKTIHLKEKAEGLSYINLASLCDDEYEKDAVDHKSGYSVVTLAQELMVLELLSNVAPNAEDITEFYKRSQEEIDKVEEELNDIIDDHPEFIDLKPAVKDE